MKRLLSLVALACVPSDGIRAVEPTLVDKPAACGTAANEGITPTLNAQRSTLNSQFTDKTLVAWVSPANLTQRGGSALTVDDRQGHFDGIVFGEVAPARWMAGSDTFSRTEMQQEAWPAETAEPGTFVQIAIIYSGSEITILRNGSVYAQYAVTGQQTFGSDCAAVIGLRHLEVGAADATFAGSIDDARVYGTALTGEQLAALTPNALSGPQPLAWWNFENGTQDLMGFFPEGTLVGSARVAGGKLVLDGKGSGFVAPASAAPQSPYVSPIHFRPSTGALADTIPFFFQGQYHVFYLHEGEAGTPWEHIVSSDLVNWTALPTALTRNPDDPNGPDGGNMFTGSVIEHQGLFHIFYTGHNPNNPDGMEHVCHATSTDCVAWTKHPEHVFGADGVHYQTKSDFRDPYVFWNDREGCFWMLLCAREAGTGKPVQGVARSQDLVAWEQLAPLVFDPPLASGTPECPDVFKCGETWYLLHSPSAGTTDVRWSRELRGPWLRPDPFMIDTSILYAAKRMTDGKRHILTGWIRDLTGSRDGGGDQWGGTQSLPREAYEGTGGQLYFRPADEVVAVFSNVYYKTKMTVRPDAPAVMDAPAHYMLDCRMRLEAHSEFTVALRQQADGTAYRLTVRPGSREAEIAGPGFSSGRSCVVDTAKPVKLQIFLQGTIIECFINDQYAFSWRAYDLKQGTLGLSVTGGSAEVDSLQIRLHTGTSFDPSFSGLPGVLTLPSNLILADGAALYYDYTGQTSDTVRVEGTLEIQGRNTVYLTAVAQSPLPRQITLFTFGTLTGGSHLGDWTLQGKGLDSSSIRLIRDETRIYLQFARDGTLISVR